MLSTTRHLVGMLAAGCLALPLHAQDEAAEAEAEVAEEAEAETPAEPADPTRVVATVNDVDITVGHMIIAMSTLPEEYQSLDDSVLFAGILEQLIHQEVLSQRFNEALPPRVVYSLENEKRSLVAVEVIETLINVPLDEALIQARYDQLYGSIDAEEEFNAAHILLETEEEAIAVKKELDEGASFTRLAIEQSIGPSGPSGGELGWFSSGMMVPIFEAAVISLEVGQVSEPVNTQFGWHIIRLNDIRKQDIPTLFEVRGQIENDLRKEMADRIILEFADEADVRRPRISDIDPGVIRQMEVFE